MSAKHEPARRPAVLVINPDLPKYGARFHEYINTTGLAQSFAVGLVTRLDAPADWIDVRRLEQRGVMVYAAEPVSPAGLSAPGGGTAMAAAGEAAAWRPRLRAFLRRIHSIASPLLQYPAEVYEARRTLANMAAALRRALAERHWDVFVIVQSRFAEWRLWLPAHVPALLVLHDVQTMAWRRRAEVAVGPLAKFSALVAAAKCRAYERRVFRRFAGVICLTEVDASLLRRWFGVEPHAVVPLPVDTDYYRPLPPAEPASPVMLFPGTMDHLPNIDAALWFAKAILPRVRAAHPGASFVIAGMRPPRAVRALDGHDGVRVTGEVPDMRPLFQAASVVVVPLRFASGARNKILEAWACGRAVVSTSVGAEGLAAEDGGNLYLADDAAGFAAAVGRVLAGAGQEAAVVAGGLASVRAHAAARVTERYRRAVAAAAVKAPAAPRGAMHLSIDMRWMVPGSAGGLEQLARALTGALLSLDRVNRYTLILPAQCAADFDLRGRGNFRILCRDSGAADLRRAGRAIGRRLGAALGGSSARWPERWALGDLARLDADIALSFTGFIHPELWALRHLVIVPDIQHEFFPEFFSAEALAERRRLFDQSLARAERICAISEFTRETLTSRLGLPAERISVAHLAAAPAYAPAEPGSEAAAAAFLARRYGLEAGKYFFFPARTWHHKNHATAIRALALLKERHGGTMALACAGGAREAQPELERLVAELGLSQAVRFLGYVDEADMVRLYRGAAALVFPSRFEGFGMPVLEAMACGTPVIAADAASLPEIAGGAALILPPLDAARWANAMHRVAVDADLRASLAARGLERASHFSWRHFAFDMLAALAALSDGAVAAAPSWSESKVESR